MEVQRQTKPFRLSQLTPIEQKFELEERYERLYNFIQSLISGLSDSEAQDLLNNTAIKSQEAHEEVCLGLLMGILTEPENASRYFRDLMLVSNDGLGLVLHNLNILIVERYLKLDETSKVQLIWVLREMLKNNILNADSLIHNLLRQIAGGDVSAKNIWLIENSLDLLIENRSWLERRPYIVADVVYTYLRLIEDHGNPHFNNLRQKEVDFCICLLREKFNECIIIGRDLIRLLQNVARIPEFEALWKDIKNNPTVLSPNFQGIQQLMQIRTSRRFIQSRLTPDMERKISFLFSSVKFGSQKRYQDWFQRQYLSTPESQSLRCDLIRFICCLIHPSNEVLSSDILPRWAVIGWIISSCTCNVATANAKLTLFYDWLFFDPEVDNIMNIEPAILCMIQSIKSHPQITVSLLDFLCRIMNVFYPPLSHLIKKGINSALNFILEKKVVSSLSVLFENPKIDIELRQLVRDCFPDFCNSNSLIVEQSQFALNSPSPQQPSSPFQFIGTNENAISNNNGFVNGGNNIQILNNNTFQSNHVDHVIVIDDKFSINEDDEDSKKCLATLAEKSYIINFDYNQALNSLNSNEIKTALIALKKEKNKDKRSELMIAFVKQLSQEDLNQANQQNVARCLTVILKDDLIKKVYVKNSLLVDEINIEEESIKLPLFTFLRELIQTPDEDSSRDTLVTIVNEMSQYSKCIGYLLIYLNRIIKPNDQTMSAYRDLVKQSNKELSECLLKDLEVCQFEEVDMFCFLVVDVFKIFSNICIDNPSIIYLIVSCIDALQLQEFICQIIQGNLVLFKKESILSVINASLEWETFEQICLWQLIDAHDISLEYILPVLSKLEYQTNSEALAHITLMLKNEEPSEEYLKCILDRNCKKNDFFTISVLRCWARDHCDKLAELVAAQLNKNLNSTTRGKKKSNQKATNISWSTEQLLVHLDFYREKVKDDMFFSNETIQTALTNVQSSCNEAQKAKFNELFSLIEDMVEQWSNNSKLNRKDTKKVKKKRTRKESSSESEQSQDESTTSTSPSKSKAVRKKKQKVVDSDSD